MSDFAYKPTLSGELVVLRPVDEGDYDALSVAMDVPDVRRLTGSHGEIGEEQAREWYRTRNDQTDRLDLAIVDKASGVYAFNPRAQRAYEKAGFTTEGVLRDALLWDGEWVDEIVMSVLAQDWVPSERDPS